MNSHIVKSIRKNDNEFSFISTFFDLIGNKDFKNAELSTLYTEKETLKTSIWRSLSAIGQDIGSSIYENILNFSDNLQNIDFCKIKLLLSMIYMTGINYTVFSNINNMPYELLNLIDVFSLKPEYLASYIKMNKDFVDSLSSQMLDYDYYTEISDFCLSTNYIRKKYSQYDNELTSYWMNNGNYDISVLNKLDNNKLSSFIIDTFKVVLRDKIEQTYKSKSEIEIYKVLSTNILLSDFVLPNNYQDKIYNDKLKYNISPTFNVELEVDNIENLKTTLSDYSEYEQIILSYEIKRREEPYLNLEPKTRYKYYRERDLKEYTEYINNEYCNILSNYLSSLEYDVDKNYILIFNITDKKSIFEENKATGEIIYHDYYINTIAKHLYDIVITIRDIRELLKLQLQKNYLRGTEILLKHTILEFLKNNIVNDLCNIGIAYDYDLDYNNIDIVEYIDPVEYFNISACTDNLSTTVNTRFWENNASTNRIGAIDNTNLFAKLPTFESQNFEFDADSIKDFYISQLNLKLLSASNANAKNIVNYTNLNEFLNLVFNIGADESFLSNGIVYDDKLIKLKNQYISSENNYLNSYNIISTDYLKVSPYIYKKFDGQNKTISEQLDDICIHLSVDDIHTAINNINKLSASIDNINELSTIENIKNFTNYLSTKYTNDLTELDNSIQLYMSSDYYIYKCNIFYKYTGLNIGDTPYYYLKNKVHPSFLLHPYLSNFIEKTNSNFAIKNTTNIVVNEMSTLIVNNISNYIDADGYLINTWKNPLNSNTDYVSRYEAESHIDFNNNENAVFGYDGFCYPPALSILKPHSDTEPDTVFEKFIEMILRDVEVPCIIIDEKIITNYYYGLNLTKEQRVFIASLLLKFRGIIYDTAVNKIVDIYKYGLDIYNNSYCLIKQYANCINREELINYPEYEKKYEVGELWMRLKNHPFPFPMFVFGTNDIDDEPLSTQLINYERIDNAIANIAYKTFERHEYREDCYFPNIQDFTFNSNKQIILITGKVKINDSTTATLTLIGEILKYVDNTKTINLDLYFLKKVDNYDTLNSQDELKTFSNENNWQFETFYQNESINGSIYSQILNVKNESTNKFDVSVSLAGWCYNLKNTVNTVLYIANELVEVLHESQISCENICTDIHDDIITIAYIGENIFLNSRPDINGTGLSNYIGNEITYNNLSNYNILEGQDKQTEYDSSTIVTKDFLILNSRFISLGENRDIYAKYTDIGCFGLVGIGNNTANPIINNIANSQGGIIKELENIRGMYKFLILTELKHNNPIDFKFFVLARMRERYGTSALYIGSEKYTVADFLSVHYYEALEADNTKSLTCYSKLSSDDHIYSPLELKQILEQYQPAIQVDENYISNDTSYYDPYVIDPYIYVGDVATIPNYYKEPFNRTNVGEDNCIFKTIASNEISSLSVSWYKHEDGNILLDFNSLFIRTNSDRVRSENKFNKKHLFLSLDKPGAAGYLNIYNDPFIPVDSPISNDAYVKIATYYLKNISDDKPKFVLSVAYDKNLEYTNIVTEHEDEEVAQFIGIASSNGELIELITEQPTVIVEK